MTIKNENQSKNQPKGKIKNKVTSSNSLDIVNLAILHTELAKILSLLDRIFNQLRIDSTESTKLKEMSRHRRELWPIKDAKECLELIIFNAALGRPQFLEHNDFVVQVTNVPE